MAGETDEGDRKLGRRGDRDKQAEKTGRTRDRRQK